jgi:hypothetical protein
VSVLLLTCLTAAVVALDKDKALYIGGTLSGDFQRAVARKAFNKKGEGPRADYGSNVVEGRIDTTSDSAFVFKANRFGSLVIPYSSISGLVFGPFITTDRIRREAKERTSPYRWSGYPHGTNRILLTITFQERADDEQDVVFELGENVLRPTLQALEHRTGHDIEFQALGACTQYKTRDDCGQGDVSELKGLSTVFIDTTGSSEWVPGESQKRILAVIAEASLGLRVVSRAEDASVLLVLRYNAGSRLQWWRDSNSSPDWAIGEVYVVGANGLRVVMLFDETLSAFRTRLAERFGRAFIQAYKEANSIK